MKSRSFSASEICTQQVSIRSDSQSDGQNFGCILGYLSMTEKMTRHRIPVHYGQLSEFERGCIIGLKYGSWTQIGESLVIWFEAMRPLENAF
ncbi:hypothetical protein TNCV_1332381 [Trichonephila clavipes]|nr:hypothetical protein TNCV_1332381 [Trichonephila clavipes]